MGNTRPAGPEGVEESTGTPSALTPGPHGLSDSGDPDATVPAGDTPGPAGTGSDRSVDGIEITSRVPNGVRDRRTAIAYARAHLTMRTYTYPATSARDIISRANFLSRYLFGACERFGPLAQSETARLLIDMEREMSRRLREAEIDENALPIIEGLTWDPDDPLAGVTEGIPPFGLLDVWITFLREPASRRRRRRIRPVPGVVEIDGDPITVTGERPPDLPRSQVITGIRLQMAPGSFAAWFLQHFGNSISSGNFRWNPTYLTRGGMTRTAFAPPLPAEYAELRRIYLDIEAGPLQTGDVRYFNRMRRELQRVVSAWEDEFSEGASDRHQGETRAQIFLTPQYNAFARVVRLNPPEIEMSSRLRSGVSRGRAD